MIKKTEPLVTVRLATEKDAEDIASLYFNTIRIINSKDYNPSQIEVWSGSAPDIAMWKDRLNSKMTFVASADDKIIGFTEFETDGHVDAFYVHHEHQGKGVASLLMSRVESEAAERGVTRLFLEASITALGFFRRKGFRVYHPQIVSYRGEKFRNYKMEKVNN